MTAKVGDILQVVAEFSHPNSSAIQNKFNFYVGGAGEAENEDIVEAVTTWLELLYENLDDLMSTGILFVKAGIHSLVFLVDHWELLEQLGVVEILTGFAGAADDAFLPPSSSLVVNLMTNVPGHVGRIYFGGFTEGANDTDGTPSATLVTAGANAGQMMSSAEVEVANSDLTIRMVILDTDQAIHRYFLSTLTRNRWYSQRRRRVDVGI